MASFVERMFFYDTVQVVRLRSRRMGVLYHALVAAIAAWVVYSLALSDGHEASCPAVVSRSLKLKGVAFNAGGNATTTTSPSSARESARTVYDATDLASTDAMGFFVPLSVRTTAQRRGRCASSEGPPCSAGNATAACAAGGVAGRDAGILTGGCDAQEGLCEVDGWRPGEEAAAPLEALEGALDFTGFVRVNVRFPCGRGPDGLPRRANNLPNSTALTPGVNLFTVREVLALAGVRADDVRETGADIVMSTSFECNLDRDMRRCAPAPFAAARIDDAAVVSSGYNVRRAFVRSSPDERVLQKLAGVRVRVQVSGRGGTSTGSRSRCTWARASRSSAWRPCSWTSSWPCRSARTSRGSSTASATRRSSGG